MSTTQLKGKVKFAKGNNEFFTTVKQRVQQYFVDKKISQHANFTMVSKTVILLTAYLGSIFMLCILQPPFVAAILVWFGLGLLKSGIGMSIMHDANHGAYSANKKLTTFNRRLCTQLEIATQYFTSYLHLHHTYTNITHMDDDIDTKLILRLSPHFLLKKFHRLQYLYAVLLYSISTLYWVFFKDFIQLIKYTKNGVSKNNKQQNRLLLFQMLSLKLVYVFGLIGLPVYLGMPFTEVLAGFLLMHFVAGFVLTLIFQLAHSVEGTTHPMPNQQGVIENNWAIHQMQTTVNFAPNNKWLSWYVGGLNFQVEHHLFPKICHVHYPKIAKIVKQTAKEFNVPYLENQTFIKAIKAHFKLLRQLGSFNMNDAIG